MELWAIILIIAVVVIALIWATVAVIGIFFARKTMKEASQNFGLRDRF